MKFRLLLTLLYLTGLLSPIKLVAQNTDREYIFTPVEDSPTQRAVTCIVEDSQGIIWMGTNGVGLYKYNGIDFRAYKQRWNDSTSIDNSLIHTAYLDTSRRLWIGTETGLNLYDRELDQFRQINLILNEKNEAGISVHAIAENDSGELFVGTHLKGLYKLDQESLYSTGVSLEQIDGVSNLLINCIVKNKGGRILIGSNQGLMVYSEENNSLMPYYIPLPEGTSLISKGIESMLVDNEGMLWLGTFSDGLIKIQANDNQTYHIDELKISDKRVLSLIQSPEGNILCGTENDGLFVLSKDGEVLKTYTYNKFDKNSIKSNSIWSLFTDSQERIWIGYYNNGVGVFDRYYDKFKDIESLPNVKNSLQSPSVSGLAEDEEGKLWIGMDGGGVDLYNPKNQSFEHLSDSDNGVVSGLSGLDVQSLFIDGDGNTWVGTWNSGIFYLPKNGRSFKNYNISNSGGGLQSNRIMSFSEDSQGTIWIGTFEKGLHSYHAKNGKFIHYGFESLSEKGEGNIRKVLVDSEDGVWLGTTGGLFKVNAIDKESPLELISLEDKMYAQIGNIVNTSFVLSLFEDKQKNIWIGTDGGGLCKYDKADDSYLWYNNSNGLDQETVASIVEADDGCIWLGGNKGLSKFDPDENTFTNFNTDDGLLANDFNNNAVYKDKGGVLYFGNYKGINYFDPTAIQTNTTKPLLYFSDFKLFNKSVAPQTQGSPLEKVISQTENLILTHKQSVFTIEFMGINYTRPKKNQYAYYLEGFEETWNYVGNTRNATYTNLSAGDYIFKVKAANNDGVWNETPLTLGLTILRPWWATNMAIASYLLLFGLLAMLAYKIVSQRIKEKRLVKFERDQRVQEEILNERKIQFFTNISHEFRTPLTLILNPLNDIIETASRLRLPESVNNKLAIIAKNTTRLIRMIEELMDFRKLHLNKMSVNASRIDLVSFVAEIESYFVEEASEKNIMLSVESDGTPIIVWADAGMLEKIIFNIVSNAFKATPENGVISIGVFRSNQPVVFPLIDEEKSVQAIEILIEDTGRGIKETEIHRVFERFYQSKAMKNESYGGVGTGIGLEVVRSFINLHKGKIEVESKEGVGTKFKILFPIGNDHFQPSELILADDTDTIQKEVLKKVWPLDKKVLTQIASSNADIITVGKRKTLLIVEDNTELRNYLKGEFSTEYSIVEAIDGEQGLNLANSKLPDIIITDIIMPNMDGFEFCSRIKQDLKTSHIPVIMLTAKTMSKDRVKGIDTGADVYLNKPFEMNVLRSHLKQLLNSRQILFRKYFGDVSEMQVSETTTSLDKSFITKVLNYISENIGDANLNVEHLAEDLFLSRSQLYRKVKALTGLTANEFIRKIRLERAKVMILSSDDSIGDIGYNVGFSSPSYFTRCFKSHFGVLPTELKSE